LALIPARSWGIGIGIPLSTLVQAATDAGKYKEALTYLRAPVPDSMFKTPVGLYYLQARGRFHHAREDFRSAVRDFQSVADLMAEWQLDVPALIPWRTDAALTQLRLGHEEVAYELVTDQLKRLTPQHARERGISLRVLAASSDLSKRPVRLRQAIKELQSCGDRLELAYALADLSQVYQAFGDVGQARRISNRAHHIARQCGTAVLTRALMPDTDAGSQDSEDTENHHVGMEPYMALSNAERRVAVLAADGYSNRQIAGKLFVTVSTVEQHLTRIYSKLKVNGRADLPFGQQYDAGAQPPRRLISPLTPSQPSHPPVHPSSARARLETAGKVTGC
jgi:DNA-binding CsgD family transcriptional regulator